MTAVGYQYVLERLSLPVLPISAPAAVRGVVTSLDVVYES